MTPKRLPVLFVALFVSTLSFGQAVSEAPVRDLIGRYVAARNGKNATAVRELFTDDADQLVSTGEWRRGVDALVSGMTKSSSKEAAKSTVTVESVRFLDTDVAIADGRYETFSATTEVSRKMWTTFIVRRTEAGWRIAAIRNMLPVAAVR